MVQRLGPRQYIRLAVMARLAERLDGDRRDITHIDEGQPRLARRQSDDPAGTIGEEVLVEPLGADQDMPQARPGELPVAFAMVAHQRIG